jgi:ABC-type maltose transport system permease subunit
MHKERGYFDCIPKELDEASLVDPSLALPVIPFHTPLQKVKGKAVGLIANR